MELLGTIWWLFFWTALGLCIGSFLNVVIYRLPRNQSIRNPVWSACPVCGRRIAWYDNLPVVSYLLLRGRCRHCSAGISPRYPMVEMLTALVVLTLFDAFFVARTREGLFNQPYLTWALSDDWPIFLAHVILFASLLAMAAIDLERYWLDIRFTNFAAVTGFVLHALWTPDHRTEWFRPHPATAAGAAGAMLGLAATWMLVRRSWAAEERDQMKTPEGVAPPWPADMPHDDWREPWMPESVRLAGVGSEVPAVTPAAPAEAFRRANPIGAFLLAALLILTVVSIGAADAAGPTLLSAPWRLAIPAVVVFVLILMEARIARPADTEIVAAIEAERFDARGLVLREFMVLLPPIVLGAGGVWLIVSYGPAAAAWDGLLQYAVVGDWRPLYGLSTAAAGYVIGGGIGWAVRIFFTLAFGKEAFGVGDIHMMAAAGCVAGWPVVLLAFFVTVFLALIAWLLTLPFKRTRAIPLVPWLALGYLVVVVHFEALLQWAPVRNAVELAQMVMHNYSQPTGGTAVP